MTNTRLLLVDDETSFREAIARRMKHRGIEVLEAGSGEDGLAVLETGIVDVVVSDVKMPGMNGIELLGRIREKYPDTEVILLTGHATASDGVAGIKAGAFDYMTKPVEFEHLLNKVRQAHEARLQCAARFCEAEFRKKMEQQMVAAERLASLGTLATGVAHEINNPLAIIREAAGWMGLILKKDEMANMPRKADFEKALDKIERGVERSRRITHQLLSFARKGDTMTAEVNPGELVAEVTELVDREAKNGNIVIAREIAGNLPPLYSDPYQIRQVLINLVTNAIHATGSGGRITMSVQGGREMVQIQVSDTGEGIPSENLEKIFEPFFTTKSPGKGTGLGLFVTRGIVERLGGKLYVASQVGQGTTFSIALPCRYELRDNGITTYENSDIFKRIDQAIK